ncbi:hypothetical protein GE061_003609 [Apolygus lucorum]|uniref:Uncharacterized protein n=1 Tax=Apolygus lucorum TaxID=248454 RepID=A0A6A4JAP0_APOLU|nr:hypothetical protein GE061_003609 [Apolygus lucorum]
MRLWRTSAIYSPDISLKVTGLRRGQPIIAVGGRQMVQCWFDPAHIVPLHNIERHERRCAPTAMTSPVFAPDLPRPPPLEWWD